MAPAAPLLTTTEPLPPARSERAASRPSARRRDSGHHRQLVGVAEHQVGADRDRVKALGRLLVRPEPAAEIDVEADQDVVRPGQLDRPEHRAVRPVRQRRRDAGQVQPAGAGEGARDRIHVRRPKRRPGAPLPVVEHLRWPERPSLADEQPGPALGIDDDPRDVDSFAAQPPNDRPPEPVVTDPPDEQRPPAEPRQANRDIRLGAGHVAAERLDVGERRGADGQQRDERLADGDDLWRLAHQPRPPARDRIRRTARSAMPSGSPSPVSQLPIPTATAPAPRKAGADSIVTPPVAISGMSRNGPRNSRTKAGPATDAGKSLTAVAPARQAREDLRRAERAGEDRAGRERPPTR